jgi:LCP family protein required for cell wall assembly
MDEGDNATSGHGSSDGPGDADNRWLSRSSRPTPGAAPWERLTPQPPGDAEAGGNHTDGVSVADLIARLTGDVPAALQPGADTGDRQPAHRWSEDDPATVPTRSADAQQEADRARATAAMAVGPDTGRRAGKAATVPRRHRHRPVLLAGRALAALMAVLALALTGAAWQWTATKDGLLKTISALDPDSRDIVDPNAQFGDENFLIIGVDSRIGENAEMGAGDTEAAEGARSDTIMLVNIPADRKRVVAVSFPRDLAITPIKCRAWDPRTGEYGPVWDEHTETYGPDQQYTETKLNSAYAFGGPKCLVKAIQKISGLSINRFMAIDFAGFAKMVDALGGVEVCTTTPLEDYELGTVLPVAGRQVIDGHTALNYVRARQVTTESNGDYGRIKRQQMFLSSLLRSLISKDTFFSLSKLNNVVNMFIADSYVDNVQTRDLVALGQSIQGVSAGRVSFVTLPTTGITDADGNEEPDDTAIDALFDAIINDDPLPGENDSNATTTPVTSTLDAATVAGQQEALTTEVVNAVTTDPGDVTVHVSNGTEQLGLGLTASSALQLHGFTVDTPDDYSKTLDKTTVMFSAGNEQAAVTVAAALGSPRIERVSGTGDSIRVVLGSDFSGVTTPLPSGSPVSIDVVHTAGATPTQLPENLTVTNGADISCD